MWSRPPLCYARRRPDINGSEATQYPSSVLQSLHSRHRGNAGFVEPVSGAAHGAASNRISASRIPAPQARTERGNGLQPVLRAWAEQRQDVGTTARVSVYNLKQAIFVSIKQKRQQQQHHHHHHHNNNDIHHQSAAALTDQLSTTTATTTNQRAAQGSSKRSSV